jgi:hypothetical protein
LNKVLSNRPIKLPSEKGVAGFIAKYAGFSHLVKLLKNLPTFAADVSYGIF